MSLRSMWGHDRLSSNASAPASWQPFARSCQCASSLSLPEPAMIDAINMRSGYAFLMPSIFGIHQSSGLSEISSQFHDECSAVSGRFCIDSWPSRVERRNFVFGPATLVTGWRPIVLVTTPPHPASNARMMLLSDSVGGADDSRNGFSNRRPVNVVLNSADIGSPLPAEPRRAKAGPLGKRNSIAESLRRAGTAEAVTGDADPPGDMMSRKPTCGFMARHLP